MARIHTIKPEFWTDEKVTQLPFEARLLFIALWNFADDTGRLKYEPGRLKLQIFPADSLDMVQLLNQLNTMTLIRIYSVDGKDYIHLPHLLQHQTIEHPSKSRLPPPPDLPQAEPRQVASSHHRHEDSRVLQNPHESSRKLSLEGKGGEGKRPITLSWEEIDPLARQVDEERAHRLEHTHWGQTHA